MRIGINILAAKSLHHGIGVYADNILSRIIPMSQEQDFFIFKRTGSFIQYDKIFDKSIKVKNINLSNIRRIIWEMTRLPGILKNENIDIFWGVCNFLPIFKACKYIVTIHDLAPFILPDSLPLIRRLYYQNLYKNSMRSADIIIVVSESLKRDIINLFSLSEEKIVVVHCGLDNKFHPISDENIINNIRTKYNLPSDFIFTLGVLEPKKNIERLIIAYAEAKKTLPDLPKLVIGGPKLYGWKNDRIFRLVQTHNLCDNVQFTDFVEHNDLPAIYSMTTLFALPSLYEGFGLPIIEAMACGTPVLTSNCSSLPEVAGNTAIFVDPRNIESIKNGIIEIISSNTKQQEMIQKGFNNVKRFSWDKAAKEIIKVFLNVYES